MMRRAILFSLDALLASLLLLAALIVVLQFGPSSAPSSQTSHYAQDALLALNTIAVGEMQDPYVQSLIANGTIDDPDRTILEQIGLFWAGNETALALNVSDIALRGLLAPGVGFSLSVEDDRLFLQPAIGTQTQRTTSRRMITGIKQGAALEGSTSAAYLKRIKDKKSFVISYVGGFVGQGNLTVQVGPVPSDVSAATITDLTVQLDTVEDFDVKINGVACALLTSDHALLAVQSWNITACKGSVSPGMNNFTFVARGALEDAYLAGGYVKVSYLTDVFVDSSSNTSLYRYSFPSIDGVINLYDSFSVPGTVHDWYLNISFLSNYTVFLRIGNQTVFTRPGENNTQQVLLEAHNLSWSPTTVPLRLGTTNLSNVTVVSAGVPADTGIVTDISGSMDDCAEQTTSQFCTYDCCRLSHGHWQCNGGSRTCSWNSTCSGTVCGACGVGYSPRNYDSYNDSICTRTKLDIAKSADLTAVGIILGVTGNRIGLVSYNDQVRQVTSPPTTDNAALTTQISSYAANSFTCICCGINRAKNMLASSTNKRFMIVMSDGDANYACANFNSYVGTSNAAKALTDTVAAGQNACDNYNITVYTIGFGSAMSAQGRSTLQQAACNASLYFDASNVSELEEIYANISNQILLIANFTAQTLVINGTYVSSRLLIGSSLDLNYTPLITPPAQNEILIKFESPQFTNCTTTLDIPPGLRMQDAVVTSYSGPYWTSSLSVNGELIFNLSDYSHDYVSVGDPFLVTIPIDTLNASSNTVRLVIADNNQNATNCSANNTVFYSGYINSSIPRSDVLSRAIGCKWRLQFDDGHFLNVTIPSSYTGAKTCFYTNASHNASSYDVQDAYDYGVFNLMRQLDFNDDGRIYVNIDAEDLEIIVTIITGVPYLWGPSLVTMEVWR